MRKRIKLLVSPKNVDEAAIVVKSKVDYIDCKNPNEGSLGANFPWVIKEMKNLIPLNSSQLLSATIGDFPYLPGSASLAALGAAFSGADIIKVGLRGPKNKEEGIDLMKNVVDAVKQYKKDIKVVTAGYADKERMDSSPDFLDLPIIAAKSGSEIVMLDTFIKDGKGLFDFLTVEQLINFKKRAKDYNLEVALAGNIKRDSIPKIKKISPDLIGVRSVVCNGYDRKNGTIKKNLIKKFKGELNL